MRSDRHKSPSRRDQGFTLVEIMVVVVIIGLLASIAIPAFQRLQRASQNSRFISDLRTFAQAFEIRVAETGTWPANVGSGVVPAGMTGSFNTGNWQARTVLGGRWNWDRNMSGVAAGISVTGFTVPDSQLMDIDAQIDDGDLDTGQFRKVSFNRVTFTLE
jgi:type IV pilus assembly protein PilA